MEDFVQDYINLIETGWIEGRKYIVEDDYYKPIKVKIKVGKKKYRKPLNDIRRILNAQKTLNIHIFINQRKQFHQLNFLKCFQTLNLAKPQN